MERAAWITVGASAAGLAFLSLLLGAVRNFSLSRCEELLEGREATVKPFQSLAAGFDQLALTLGTLRVLLLLCGTVALTGATIARTLREAAAPIPPSAWLLASSKVVGLGVLLFVILGSLVPGALGERRAEELIFRLRPLLRPLERLMAPVSWLAQGVYVLTWRLFNVRGLEKEEEIKDEILAAARVGEHEGLIDQASLEVIENLMEFRDVDVTEVMTPRIDIQAVDAADDQQTLVAKAIEYKRSRLPVYDGSVDKIVGVLMVKDLLAAVADPEADPRVLFRKPFFVPETKRVADLLKEFRTRKIHMAIVADEYGGTAGLVTIEDLIEELIGEIDDEHDSPDVPVRRLSANVIDVDAKLHIDELNEEYGTKVPEDEDVETVGGYVALRLGRIPKAGDEVTLNGTSFVVTEADERRVSRVRVRLK
ncbi:MAG: HlyC/CorC family transporter [Planctomycetes bacterium]|nr:HlyC/CorC family transporter [Planctomycetota bacterium]